jgi:2-polyprenyl-3-methyl-5-hydroxy-6-metoxy-1,4-benzoquinol methylase
MSVYSNNQLKKESSNEAWTKIFEYIKPGTKILDIGCSSGQLGAALKKEKSVYVVGLDIDKDDVSRAKKNLDEAYIGNVESDDLSKYGAFDYVVMADVIEHLVQPEEALKKVKKMLNKNGKLVFSIPNMANVTTRLELLKGTFMYKDFGLLDRTHLHFYDQTEVNRVFNDAGFVVKKTNCTLREIPDKLLAKELSEVGIELNPKLHKVLSSFDASVYQFIGIAEPGKTPTKLNVSSTTQLDIISVEIENLRDAQAKELTEHRDVIKRLETENKRLDQELSAILNSKGWKALKKIHSTKSRIKK